MTSSDDDSAHALASASERVRLVEGIWASTAMSSTQKKCSVRWLVQSQAVVGASSQSGDIAIQPVMNMGQTAPHLQQTPNAELASLSQLVYDALVAYLGPAPNLGLALAKARGLLSAGLYDNLRRLHRAASSARHSQSRQPLATFDGQEILQQLQLELRTAGANLLGRLVAVETRLAVLESSGCSRAPVGTQGVGASCASFELCRDGDSDDDSDGSVDPTKPFEKDVETTAHVATAHSEASQCVEVPEQVHVVQFPVHLGSGDGIELAAYVTLQQLT